MPKRPIDPLEGPRLAVAGRLVLMDDAFTVIRRGVLYIDKGLIVVAQDRAAPPPPGFASVPVVETRGTLFPGLIELHNHLSYNALRLWDVPKRYSNRDQWSGTPEYRKLISGPMTVVGRTPSLLPALIRYVECKSLVGGVSTSQGIQLFSNAGIRRFYRGIVRNVEQTDDPDLPEAATRVADVDARDAALFRARLLKQSCFLLHLSEGTDASARRHFLALQLQSGEWAIARQLAGIHSAALGERDFGIMAEHQGAMVWSPMSNFLLYGATAKVQAAKTAGVRISIGPDWSPSGSKNLLGELKVARLYSQTQGGIFSDREIVALATRNAASILQWQPSMGTLEPGRRADVLAISGTREDPYAALIGAEESDVRLVMINGVPRYGTPTLMERLGAAGERLRVARVNRMLFLKQATGDPDVQNVTLGEALRTLRDAFRRLPQLALELERPPARARGPVAMDRPEPVVWMLALDELQDSGVDLRHRLPFRGGSLTGATRAASRAAQPLSQILQPMELDPLTVADDGDLFDRVRRQRNLPDFIKQEFEGMY